MTGRLFVQQEGHGPRVVLLHGGVLVGGLSWSAQHSPAERWALLIVDRAGYGRSDHLAPGEDAEVDAPLVAELLEDGAQLVGQSAGAVAAMPAAARRPEAVLSLTLSEPPAFQLVPDSPEAQELAAALISHIRGPGEAGQWVRSFMHLVGGTAVSPDELPPALVSGVRAVRAARTLPWEVKIPIEVLAAAPFPTLVISGNHRPAFEAVCDVFTEQLGTQRARVVGAGHSIPHTGVACNQTLEGFLCTAATRRIGDATGGHGL